ncbi:MAG TPA: class A beta-lactamase-related serine hydrolase [Saprospiraceae bacterium]|nr:class A beta-lactamase-related serine hydrolase [Saprospiraceae bacterium]
MISRKVLPFLLCFFIFSSLGYSQNQDSLELATYLQAKEHVSLIKNMHFLVPLKNLDKEKIAFLSLSKKKEIVATFLGTLNKSQPITPVIFDQVKGTSQSIPKEITTLIVGIDEDMLSSAALDINELCDSDISIVLAVFGNQDASTLTGESTALHDLKAPVIVVGTAPSSAVAGLMAQMIFGGVDVQFSQAAGEKEPQILQQYQSTNIPTNATRLGYVPPAAVNINGQLLRDSISASVNEGIKAGAYPGAQVLVAKDGKVIYHQAFGYHTYDSIAPVQTTDLYDFASLSKVTTSLPILMMWYGEGTFDLYQTLAHYMPYFITSHTADLTFRLMLAHYARLRPWIPYWRSTLRGCAKYPWQKRWKPNNRNNGKFKWRTFKKDSSARYSIYVTDDLWLYKDYKNKIFKAIKK